MTGRSLIVQFDVDGVLCDFVGGCLRVMRTLGFEFEPHHVVEWNVAHVLPERARDEFWRRVELPGFCAGLDPYPGARELLESTYDAGHEVRFLTSPMKTPHWQAERRAWLEQHFAPAFAGEDPVTFDEHKHAHPGDVLVDDKPEHCEAWASTGRPALLLHRPYNADWHAYLTKGVYRAQDYEAVRAILGRLGGGRG